MYRTYTGLLHVKYRYSCQTFSTTSSFSTDLPQIPKHQITVFQNATDWLRKNDSSHSDCQQYRATANSSGFFRVITDCICFICDRCMHLWLLYLCCEPGFWKGCCFPFWMPEGYPCLVMPEEFSRVVCSVFLSPTFSPFFSSYLNWVRVKTAIPGQTRRVIIPQHVPVILTASMRVVCGVAATSYTSQVYLWAESASSEKYVKYRKFDDYLQNTART